MKIFKTWDKQILSYHSLVFNYNENWISRDGRKHKVTLLGIKAWLVECVFLKTTLPVL